MLVCLLIKVYAYFAYISAMGQIKDSEDRKRQQARKQI